MSAERKRIFETNINRNSMKEWRIFGIFSNVNLFACLWSFYLFLNCHNNNNNQMVGNQVGVLLPPLLLLFNIDYNFTDFVLFSISPDAWTWNYTHTHNPVPS